MESKDHTDKRKTPLIWTFKMGTVKMTIQSMK